MKMNPYTNIDEYIANFPKETQEVLKRIRNIIEKAMPQAEQVISYGIPTFKLNGKSVIFFAGYEHHVSIYPIPKGPDAFQNKIEPYVVGKGTVKFMLNKPIPFGLIGEIVEQSIVDFKERTSK